MVLPLHTGGEIGLSYPIFRLPIYPQATGTRPVIKATLDDVCGLTRGTHDAVGPAQLTNRLITLDIIDEMLDVDLHGWTPVRARGMGCRQYTPSSNATTLESKKSGTRLQHTCSTSAQTSRL